MPAEITYWSSRDDGFPSHSSIIAHETRSTSASSAQSGTTPADAKMVSVFCTTAAIRVAYSANPTASAASAYIGLNERLWLTARPGSKIAAINA